MKNKIFKYIGLEVLLLLALMLCGTIVVKIFNVALKLQFENIGIAPIFDSSQKKKMAHPLILQGL